MRAIWTIAANDLRLMLTERAALVVRLIMPVAFIIVVGLANDAFQTGEAPVPVLDVVDYDASPLSAFYVDYLSEHAEQFSITTSANDPTPRLDSGLTDFAVVIPDGFAASLTAGTPVTMTVLLAVSDPQQATRLQSLLDSANQRTESVVRAGLIAADAVGGTDGDTAAGPALRRRAGDAALARAAELLLVDRLVVEADSVALPARYELIGFQQSVPGMGSMFVMLSVLAGATLLIEERRRFTLQRTMIAPVSRAAFIGGKVMGRFVIGMV